MPFKDIEVKRHYDRILHRDKRHPGWRQTYLDYNGMCAECGEIEGLEFHEPFGEDKGNNSGPKFQVRVPLCNPCHSDEHKKHGDRAFGERCGLSYLQADVKWEMEQAGGLEGWMVKFGLEPSKNYIPRQMQEGITAHGS